jgi:uncharacterized protein DUF4340
MSPRNRKLAAIFGVLFIATLAVEKPWRGDAHQRTTATIEAMFPDLKGFAEVASVRISKAGQATTIARILDRGKPRWVVREKFDHPADLRRLGRLIDSLMALETRDIESTNSDKQSAYEVGIDQGMHIEIWDQQGGKLADLVAGSMRSQDMTAGQIAVLEFFVRPTDGDVVYRTGELLVPFEDPADWCDGQFLAGVEEPQLQLLQRIDHLGPDSWKLIRQSVEEGQKWKMIAPDARAVADFVGDSWAYTMHGLRAADVLGLLSDPQSAEIFGPLRDTLKVGIDEIYFELELGRLVSKDRRAARVKGLPHLYALQQYDVDQLLQSVASMQKE